MDRCLSQLSYATGVRGHLVHNECSAGVSVNRHSWQRRRVSAEVGFSGPGGGGVAAKVWHPVPGKEVALLSRDHRALPTAESRGALRGFTWQQWARHTACRQRRTTDRGKDSE